MKQHFVKFFTPGTFVAEQSVKEIELWDVPTAQEMAKEIKERYNAVPYGFQFFTKERRHDELDSKVTDTSPMYYINCRVKTLEEVEAENNPKNSILISNMKRNGYDRIVETIEGWKWTQPLNQNDIVLQD